MTVSVDGAQHTAEHHETQYYFCGAGCRAAFLTDPESDPTRTPTAAPEPGVLNLNAPNDHGARQ